jgi:ankyrin repeat protein
MSNGQSGAAKYFRKKVLHAAVWNGFPTAAEVLLAIGTNVNEKDKYGRTPLS